jgi:hypothetical protein
MVDAERAAQAAVDPGDTDFKGISPYSQLPHHDYQMFTNDGMHTSTNATKGVFTRIKGEGFYESESQDYDLHTRKMVVEKKKFTWSKEVKSDCVKELKKIKRPMGINKPRDPFEHTGQLKAHDWAVLYADVGLYLFRKYASQSASMERDLVDAYYGLLKAINRVTAKSQKVANRNDRVNVQYRNGTVKRDVKFKNVENDVLSGDAVLVD